MMTDLIDKVYFQELSEQNPIDVCRRALCSYDETNKFYTVSVWDELYKIYPHQFRIEYLKEGHERLHPYLDLFTVHYLLKAKEIEPANQWISEKDIPGGSTFFRGPHEIPTNLITVQFNGNIEGFNNKCEQLMGSPLRLADAAFSFKITPRIPVAVLYWAGDDEFPSESKILYDKTIAEQLASDIIYALAVGVCERLSISALNLKPGDTVVDIGCGTGLNFPLLQQAVTSSGKIIGVDVSDAMLEQARQTTAANQWENIQLVCADAAQYEFPSKVDAVVSAYTLILVPDCESIVSNARAALVPGGHLVVLDMSWPKYCPLWCRHVLFFLRSYGVTADVIRRRSWEILQRSMRNQFQDFYKRQFWVGFFYITCGTAGCIE